MPAPTQLDGQNMSFHDLPCCRMSENSLKDKIPIDPTVSFPEASINDTATLKLRESFMSAVAIKNVVL